MAELVFVPEELLEELDELDWTAEPCREVTWHRRGGAYRLLGARLGSPPPRLPTPPLEVGTPDQTNKKKKEHRIKPGSYPGC